MIVGRVRGKLGLAAMLLLASCSFAPKYHTPEMALPQNYKEAGDWLPADSAVANMDRGAWWKIFGDEDLNVLEDKVTTANQNLKAAVARYGEARAVAAQARAAYFPTITAQADPTHLRLSRNIANVAGVGQYNDFQIGGDLSYEIDVWGRVRNLIAANESLAKASDADRQALELSLHSEMAIDYFALRGQDATQKIADDTVVDYQKALNLTKNQHEGGIVAAAEVDQAETQLENAKTLAADTHLNRAQLEHAIAVLAGENPSDFSLPGRISNTTVVPVVPALPSKLLEQRPDIAAADLRVEAANANIGVAKAAFFPDFIISAQVGLESAVIGQLLKAPSLFWSIGPSALQPIFEGGRITALSDQAHAEYDEAVADYRQTVLSAFQDVEDNLVALKQLAAETQTQTAATKAAENALNQAQFRYQGGLSTYLDIVLVQNIALQAELNQVNVHTRSLTANVLLIESLGGSWQQPGKADSKDETIPVPALILPDAGAPATH